MATKHVPVSCIPIWETTAGATLTWLNSTLVFSAGAEPVRRADMYDYDFAITSLNGLFGYYLYLMVISDTRPQGDSTSFAEANSKTVVSVVRLYNSGFEDDYWRCDRAVAWSPKASENRIASFSCPRIVSYAD